MAESGIAPDSIPRGDLHDPATKLFIFIFIVARSKNLNPNIYFAVNKSDRHSSLSSSKCNKWFACTIFFSHLDEKQFFVQLSSLARYKKISSLSQFQLTWQKSSSFNPSLFVNPSILIQQNKSMFINIFYFLEKSSLDAVGLVERKLYKWVNITTYFIWLNCV